MSTILAEEDSSPRGRLLSIFAQGKKILHRKKDVLPHQIIEAKIVKKKKCSIENEIIVEIKCHTKLLCYMPRGHMPFLSNHKLKIIKVGLA